MLQNVKNNIVAIAIVLLLHLLYGCNNNTGTTETASVDTLAKKTINVNEQNPFITRNTNIRDGDYEEHYPNGILKMKGTYSNGKRHGVWMSFYEDGNLWSEGYFNQGVREGKTVSFHPGGKKFYEGYYTNGKESGTWKYYDKQGLLVKEEQKN